MDRQTDITQEQALVKLAFVILNYNTYEETIACIHSINDKIDTQDYKIIVVDNASTDNSLERLKEAFSCPSGANVPTEKIELLYNKENLGFARGNNVGIRYVNEKYRPEFVVVLNSDTELIQRDLYSKLHREFENSGFALLGPMILTADGRYTNSPLPIPTKEWVLRELRILKRNRMLLYFGLLGFANCIHQIKTLISHKFRLTKELKADFSNYHRKKQVPLAGAFLVFSHEAFNHINGFNELTFLYREEELLYLELLRHGLTIVYTPEICIYHQQGQATKKVKRKTKDRVLFGLKCIIDSDKILLDALESVFLERPAPHNLDLQSN